MWNKSFWVVLFFFLLCLTVMVLTSSSLDISRMYVIFTLSCNFYNYFTCLRNFSCWIVLIVCFFGSQTYQDIDQIFKTCRFILDECFFWETGQPRRPLKKVCKFLLYCRIDWIWWGFLSFLFCERRSEIPGCGLEWSNWVPFPFVI